MERGKAISIIRPSLRQGPQRWLHPSAARHLRRSASHCRLRALRRRRRRRRRLAQLHCRCLIHRPQRDRNRRWKLLAAARWPGPCPGSVCREARRRPRLSQPRPVPSSAAASHKGRARVWRCWLCSLVLCSLWHCLAPAKGVGRFNTMTYLTCDPVSLELLISCKANLAKYAERKFKGVQIHC